MSGVGCRWQLILGVAAALLTAPAVQAQGKVKALGPFEKEVNAAIDRGIRFLTAQQKADGSMHEKLGGTALAALAMLEGGVPAKDKRIQLAAAYIRSHALTESFVYSVAPAILFLDRLGDPQDVPLIESLAVRLLAGQNRNAGGGGWSYHTPMPDAGEVARIQKAMAAAAKAPPGEKKPRTYKDLPKEIRDQISAVYRGAGMVDTKPQDLSNTQFALIGLWVSRRHGIPAEQAFAAAEQRMRRTQFGQGTGANMGAWSYQPGGGGGGVVDFDHRATPQMTCAGLMVMAMAYAVNDKNGKVKREMHKDPSVLWGLHVMKQWVGAPFKDTSMAPQLATDALNKNYYYLWTLERAMVLFGVNNVNGNDWYKWGAQILLRNQNPANGSWNGAYPGVPDTCFALLFLKRVDLAQDLSKEIKKAKGRPKLLEMIGDKSEGEGLKSDLKVPGGKGGRSSRLAPSEPRPELHRPQPSLAWEALPRRLRRPAPSALARG
jgi:hypothetical protein